MPESWITLPKNESGMLPSPAETGAEAEAKAIARCPSPE